MVEGIVFKADRFRKADDYNSIDFTMNTVILCKNYKLMDSLTKEIVNTINVGVTMKIPEKLYWNFPMVCRE